MVLMAVIFGSVHGGLPLHQLPNLQSPRAKSKDGLKELNCSSLSRRFQTNFVSWGSRGGSWSTCMIFWGPPVRASCWGNYCTCNYLLRQAEATNTVDFFALSVTQ